MKRVALYARYSSDLQRDSSIEDQLRLCEERARREGWTVVKSYADRAQSGTSMMRSGVQQLLQDAMAGRIDIVLTESLDRISRDQEGIAHFYKRAKHAEVDIITLAEGKIDELHIGLKGTMGALYIKDLAQKTHRGMRGRAEEGKAAGGNCYGYDVVRRYDAKGEPVRGERQINESESAIILRIFKDYAKGKSPKKIAFELNREQISGPQGGSWGQTTINGNRKRGTGILNNELYIGKLAWNRHRYLKDPDTGKRVCRPNPESEWVRADVPELRIVPDELWEKARNRQLELEHRKPEFWNQRRPQKLFSFLLRCGSCGGGYSKISASQYGCSNCRNKGTCDNRLTISSLKLERAVLGALQSRLMDPELCEVFCTEYTKHLNQQRIDHNAQLAANEAEHRRVKREIDKFIDAIANGIDPKTIKDRFNALEARRSELEEILSGTERAPVLIHPNMGHRYAVEVNNLIASLNDEEHRIESAELLRKLIEKIVLTPNPDKSNLVIDLHGDLAGILHLAQGQKPQTKRKTPAPHDKSRESEVSQAKMVAGTRFELMTFRL